jgi:DNA mismatch repair protein MutS
MAEFTPMKRQYSEIKSNYKDCLLFFRLGDFYEMFDEDAKTASKELDLTLTTRDRGVENPDERTPMCGVPYHSSEAYIARLIAKGYKVAICEQMEDPALAKGLVSREVIRVITPGTVTESSMLEEGKSNYICAIYLDSDSGSVAFCDISTGEFSVMSFKADAPSHIMNELGCFCPREAVLNPEAADSIWLIEFLGKRLECIWEQNEERFDLLKGSSLVCSHFKASGLESLGLDGEHDCIRAAGGLLSYIIETQKTDLGHINSIEVVSDQRYMELDYTTRRNLELTENQRTGEKKGSLLWVLDKTRTPMGSRLLRSWTEKPLRSPIAIKRRLSAVQELYLNHVLRGELMNDLKEIGDIQRLIGRAVYGTANGRDLLALGNYCDKLPHIIELLAQAGSSILREAADMDALGDIRQLIKRSICDEPPFSVREGGIVRTGYSEEIDHLREIRDNGAMMVAQLEIRERERTGIKKLKIGYNRVFGYYIDVPRSTGDDVPADFIRKQTLVSNERYFTEELKELENKLLTARDRIAELEYQLFTEVRQQVASQVTRIQAAAETVAHLDALC